jgi:hypothetical protein
MATRFHVRTLRFKIYQQCDVPNREVARRSLPRAQDRDH